MEKLDLSNRFIISFKIKGHSKPKTIVITEKNRQSALLELGKRLNGKSYSINSTRKLETTSI